MTTRKYSSRSQQTTLTSAVTSGASIIPVANALTLLGGAGVTAGQTFTVVIDPDTALEEIVDVTVVSSNNLTVTRAVDMAGTLAQDHSSGAVVRHMIIGRDMRESNLHIEATGSYNDGTSTHAMHGLGASDGVVVGTDALQTLTRKTLTSPTITGLSTPTNSGDAVPKSYVDTLYGTAAAAATSAASAATSASSAATSASSAATTYTGYDARYLGPKASAPTVDNLGGVLLVGATYWNTANTTMWVWSGSTWNAISTASGYTAPTLGSTALSSGSTVTTVNGLVKIVSNAHASLDANSREQDIALMNIMSAW